MNNKVFFLACACGPGRPLFTRWHSGIMPGPLINAGTPRKRRPTAQAVRSELWTKPYSAAGSKCRCAGTASTTRNTSHLENTEPARCSFFLCRIVTKNYHLRLTMSQEHLFTSACWALSTSFSERWTLGSMLVSLLWGMLHSLVFGFRRLLKSITRLEVARKPSSAIYV